MLTIEYSECGANLSEETERRVKDESDQYSSNYDEEEGSRKTTSFAVKEETSESNANSETIQKAEEDIAKENEDL